MKCFFFSISSGWPILIHYSSFDPEIFCVVLFSSGFHRFISYLSDTILTKIRMHPEQKKIYQSMTPVQKLDVSMKLYQSAKALKTATIKEQHQDWNEDKIRKMVNDIFLYART
jgi:hypothetical protein